MIAILTQRFILCSFVFATLLFSIGVSFAEEGSEPFYHLDIGPSEGKWVHVCLYPDSDVTEIFVEPVELRNQTISEKETVGGRRNDAAWNAGYHGGLIGLAIVNGMANSDRHKTVRKPILDFLNSAGSNEILTPFFEKLMIDMAVEIEQDVNWEQLVPSLFPKKKRKNWKQPVLRMLPSIQVSSDYRHFDIELAVEIDNQNIRKRSKQRVFEGRYAYRITADQYVDNLIVGEFHKDMNAMDSKSFSTFLKLGYSQIMELFYLDLERRLVGESRVLNKPIRYQNKIAKFYLRGNLVASEDHRLIYYELNGRLVNVGGMEIEYN